MRGDLPADWRWGDPVPVDDTAVLPPPVDPWDGYQDHVHWALTPSPTTNAGKSTGGRRPVYGRIYELFTDDPRDGEHPYAGQVKAPRTIAQRKREHKRADEIARHPWKARILDGPRGHRLLETVYATGDEATDDRELDRAEAFWIDRLKTTHNGVRPVRPRAGDPLPPKPKEKTAPVRRAPARKRRPFNWRLATFLTITAVFTYLSAQFVVSMEFPWPWAPWVVAPTAGVGLAWTAFGRLLRAGRRLKMWR